MPLSIAPAVRLPSPFAPVLHAGEPAGIRAQRWAAVLATARRQIADYRFTGFTMQRLAGDVGLSTQAIFNRYGSRDALMAAAINDYTVALMQYGMAARPGANPLLSFALAFADVCDTYPEYFRRIPPNTFFERTGARVFALTHAFGTNLIHEALLDQQRRSAIAADADLRVVATSISTLMGATLLEWAQGAIRITELRRQIHYKTELMLRAVQGRA